MVLLDHLFARATRTTGQAQDKATILRWVDPHRLKKLNNKWTKDGKEVITRKVEDQRDIIRSLHDPPTYGHPGISQTVNFIE